VCKSLEKWWFGFDAIWQATYDFLLVFYCNYISIWYYFQDIITYFEKCKGNMILNMSPVGSNLSHTSKYWPSSICIPHSLAPPKIGKETTKLYEIRWCHLSSLTIAPYDRSHMTFYWPSIITTSTSHTREIWKDIGWKSLMLTTWPASGAPLVVTSHWNVIKMLGYRKVLTVLRYFQAILIQCVTDRQYGQTQSQELVYSLYCEWQ